MPLIPYFPFRDLERFFEEEFGAPILRERIVPSADIYETDKDVVVEIEVPGIDPEKVDISIRENVLKIEGEERKEREEKKRGYYRKEIRSGHFRRLLTLPTEVKPEKAKATYKDGILRIVIPKKIPAKLKEKETKIKVKVERA